MATRSSGSSQAIYVISVAAELAGVHPQTLRVYERKGLLTPQRTAGNTRRYSERDIDRLRRIQELTQEGINLAGVLQIMDLERRLEEARDELRVALEELGRRDRQLDQLLGARDAMSMVPARDVRRMRRAMRSDVIDQATRRRIFQAPAVSEDSKRNSEV